MAARFPASVASDFINAQITYVDGGILAMLGGPDVEVRRRRSSMPAVPKRPDE